MFPLVSTARDVVSHNPSVVVRSIVATSLEGEIFPSPSRKTMVSAGNQRFSVNPHPPTMAPRVPPETTVEGKNEAPRLFVPRSPAVAASRIRISPADPSTEVPN